MYSALLSLAFLTGALATPTVKVIEWESNWGSSNATVRSCDLEKGTVCIPTACYSNVCSLFKNAVCVPDRCGCEARWFKWMEEEKTYSDVSKMCSSSNFVMNFLTFTKMHANKSAAISSVADEIVVRQFFKEFNMLVTEILKDITDYIRTVTEASPTQANIDKLKQILRTMELRSKTATSASADETVKERLNLGSVLKKVGPFAGLVVGSLLSDEQADLEVKSFLGSVAKGALSLAKEVLLSDDGVTPSRVGKQFFVDAKTLQDIVSDKGSYADAVKSGKVAVSDKAARKELKEIPLTA